MSAVKYISVKPLVTLPRGFLLNEKTEVTAGGARGKGVWAAEVGVGVAGVNTLISSKTTPFRRIMWGTTLVVSLLVLVAVMGYQMNYFLSYPVNVDVQVIHSTSLRFPAVTICPYPRNNMMTMGRSPLAVREAYQQVVGEEYPGLRNASRELENLLNTKDLWDATAWNVSAMIHECYQGRGVLCNETGAFTLIYTLFGPCLTFRGAPTTLAGSYHGLYVKLDYEPWEEEGEEEDEETGAWSPKGWWVVVHEEEEDPSLLIKTHGYFIGFTWNKEISLSLKQFESLNTRSKHCEEDPHYRQSHCQNDCFSRAFSDALHCRLPFMRVDSPYCQGREVLESADDLLTRLLLEGEWQPHLCHCPVPCRHTVYHYQGDTTDDRTDRKARIKVFFLDMVFEEVVEELSYPFASLVADFGGMAGLLLGASLLTALEVVECCVVGLARLCVHRRGVLAATHQPKVILRASYGNNQATYAH